MTDPPLSTMAPPEAAAPPTVNQPPRNAPPTTPDQPVTKRLVTREHDLTIRAFFPAPSAPTKFNPTSAMHQLLRTMLKDEPSLVLHTPNNDQQIVLASESLPIGEKAFKQFFKVSNPRAERQNLSYFCIGCHVFSNRTLGNIKFHSPENQLLTWLKKNKVFVESDNLGTDRPVTVGYFTKIDPTITHLANFHAHLVNQLMLIEIDVDTAIELAPHLKTAQADAMSNGDDFVPILPPFELYKTRLTAGREPSQVKTEVIGVKGAPKDAKLLGEFFTRMASEGHTDARDGVFLPRGAANLLGPATYTQVLQENNFFLNNVATIPVNLEHKAWFAIIDPNNHSETDPVTLHEHLLRKSWFLRVKSITRSKCMVVTTKSNLTEEREWLDNNLEKIIRKSIPPGYEPPSSQLPRRLDKPVYTTTYRTYADILKKQFSLESTTPRTAMEINRPPRKRQASILDYDSDPSIEYPPLPSKVVTAPASNPSTTTTEQQLTTVSPECATMLIELKNEIQQLKQSMQPASTTTPTKVDYAAELQSLKSELQSLRNFINTAVEQLKTEIVSIHAPTTAMETDLDHATETTPEISELIADLKQDIANVAIEMRAKFQKQEALATAPRIPFQLTPFPT